MSDVDPVFETPTNEPVRDYAPGSPERAAVEVEIASLSTADPVDLPMVIDGVARLAGGERFDVVMPHNHRHVLGHTAEATAADVQAAVDAALRAAPAWGATSFADRAAVFLRAADLLAGPWRDRLNATTMLGQSKSVFQAEIDSACELIDFFRFNVHFAGQIQADQPLSVTGVDNRMDYRPLEGFVLAITPFNFTSIAGNLPTAPALLGNCVVWKPSPTQQYSAQVIMDLLAAAGLPPGVINMVTGHGGAVSEVALVHPRLAGIHFTGSTPTFQHLWSTVGSRLGSYASYPRLVGETGGKDFVLAHPSADPSALVTGLVRGAFEYQGQKCSAASRAYVPRSLWDDGVRDALAATTEALAFGDVADLSLFGGAVIDARSFGRLSEALTRARSLPSATVLTGGTVDDSQGYFVSPTVIVGDDPRDEIFTREYFGPILAVHVYDDSAWPQVLELVDTSTPYALTGAVFAQDAAVVEQTAARLRFAAGNFYVNDKPTGAVVGQQPFGGARASGTNDKAGSMWNLIRWVSPRVIKTNLAPPTQVRYPHQD